MLGQRTGGLLKHPISNKQKVTMQKNSQSSFICSAPESGKSCLTKQTALRLLVGVSKKCFYL
jgi:hypothetical protein